MFFRESLRHLRCVDAGRPDGGVAHQLRGAPDEGQELVVVEPPDAVRPGRLQPGMKH